MAATEFRIIISQRIVFIFARCVDFPRRVVDQALIPKIVAESHVVRIEQAGTADLSQRNDMLVL